MPTTLSCQIKRFLTFSKTVRPPRLGSGPCPSSAVASGQRGLQHQLTTPSEGTGGTTYPGPRSYLSSSSRCWGHFPHLCVQRYLDRCGFSSAGFLSGAWHGLATGSESGYAPDAIKTPHPIKLNSQVFIADKLSAY